MRIITALLLVAEDMYKQRGSHEKNKASMLACILCKPRATLSS